MKKEFYNKVINEERIIVVNKETKVVVETFLPAALKGKSIEELEKMYSTILPGLKFEFYRGSVTRLEHFTLKEKLEK